MLGYYVLATLPHKVNHNSWYSESYSNCLSPQSLPFLRLFSSFGGWTSSFSSKWSQFFWKKNWSYLYYVLFLFQQSLWTRALRLGVRTCQASLWVITRVLEAQCFMGGSCLGSCCLSSLGMKPPTHDPEKSGHGPSGLGCCTQVRASVPWEKAEQKKGAPALNLGLIFSNQ